MVLSSQNESHSSRKYRVSWFMDLPRREVLVRVLFSQGFHVFYIRYSLDMRNPEALLLHTILRRGTRTQFLPFYAITCSGLSGKEGFSTSVPHSQTGLRVSHQGSKQWEPNTSTSSSQKALSVGCPTSPESWDHSPHPNFFFSFLRI